MKLNISFVRTLLLLTVAIATSSIDVFAQDVAPTPWREWDFNNRLFEKIGRYRDHSGSINMQAAANDWEKIDWDEEIEEAYWENDELKTKKSTVNLAHAFSKKNIVNSVIDNSWPLNETTYMFGNRMDNIYFNAPAGCFGFCNESQYDEIGHDCQDRYIALKAGASFTIPDLQVNDWVVIKMDRNAGTAILHINGAQDALGKSIDPNTDYGIGGCQWFNNGANKLPSWRGEYHFKATDNSMTFTFVNNSAYSDQMLKLYNIKVYRDYNVYPSENSIVCERHYGQTFYYYKDDTNSGADKKGNYSLHYRGKAEKSKVVSVLTSGNLPYTINDFTTDDKQYKYYLQSIAGKWGIFKIRMASMDHFGNYTTDYADRICSQTYLNKVDYPCTWDFTDLHKYFIAVAGKEDPANLQDGDLAFWKVYGDYQRDPYCFQMGVNKIGEGAGHNAQYVNGGELHLGDYAFPELKGLGVSAYNWGGHLYNDQLKVTSEGIEINSEAVINGENQYTPFKFHIPEIGGTSSEPAAVYVRVKQIDASKACFKYQKGSAGATDMELVGTDTETSELVYRTPQITSNDNVVIWLNGCVVKKIAVTKDFKDVNSAGYSTECRARDIDHTLTPYFTAGKIKAYRVSAVDYEKSEISLNEVDKILPAASANGDEGLGVILYNTKEGTDKTFSGFGLFVADIHDTKTLSGTNLLCANLIQNDNIGKSTDGNVNYLLNAQGTNVVTGETVTGIAFYRASKTAKLGPNKAYLPMAKSAGAKMSMVFIDEEVENSETTGITVVNTKRTEDNVFYTLSGVKVERPTEGGIYIKNGKKVIIK